MGYEPNVTIEELARLEPRLRVLLALRTFCRLQFPYFRLLPEFCRRDYSEEFLARINRLESLWFTPESKPVAECNEIFESVFSHFHKVKHLPESEARSIALIIAQTLAEFATLACSHEPVTAESIHKILSAAASAACAWGSYEGILSPTRAQLIIMSCAECDLMQMSKTNEVGPVWENHQDQFKAVVWH